MHNNVLLMAIKEHTAKFIDLRFTNILGKEQHLIIPVAVVDARFSEEGIVFDGSACEGWQAISSSDLILAPDLSTLHHDPFCQENTLSIRCNVIDPQTERGYQLDPRAAAQKTEAYLQATGIADQVFIGCEAEFFLFDNVQWKTQIDTAFYQIDAEEAPWNSGKTVTGGNTGHRPGRQGGYLALSPIDTSQEIRSALCQTLAGLGIVVEAHHHAKASANQCTMVTGANSLTKKADEMQTFKHVVRNIAHNYGKTATFMPKPLVGDHGSGLHCHHSLMKDGINLFAGNHYANLSETALYYIGGIIKHARALNALTNPATNSYKRLVSDFTAPSRLTYSAHNRLAAIYIPMSRHSQASRITLQFPDATANSYLAFSATVMAGIDGILQKMHPGEVLDHGLDAISAEPMRSIVLMANSLEQAVEALRNDHDFLLAGNVFNQDLIAQHIALREIDIQQMRSLVHPMEFELYYSS